MSISRFHNVRWLAGALAVVSLAVSLTGRMAAQSNTFSPNQNQRKALVLFSFAKYTEWPKEAFADEKAPFVLGILGKDPFGKDIDIINGKPIKGRKLVVKYFSSVEEVTACHLVFISSSEADRLPRILKRLANSSVLTTAEAEGFIEQSGIINLVPERKATGTETVDFEVNQAAAEKANLKLDTQLLRLAKKVKT